MRLGYNTNGMPFHRLDDALDIIADAGLSDVALTLDHHHLDPRDEASCLRRAESVLVRLDALGLRATVETGARFILDPRRKHQPTLISGDAAGRQRRLSFLMTAVRVAERLGAECVSIWSGAADDGAGREACTARLVDGLGRLLDEAAARRVRIGFEPEPGMLIERLSQFDELASLMGRDDLQLTLDVNHVHCLDDGDMGERIRRYADVLCNVHLSDARRGVHEHLAIGDGEIDFRAVRQELMDAGFTGPVHLELSRHGHDAVRAMQASLQALKLAGW